MRWLGSCMTVDATVLSAVAGWSHLTDFFYSVPIYSTGASGAVLCSQPLPEYSSSEARREQEIYNTHQCWYRLSSLQPAHQLWFLPMNPSHLNVLQSSLCLSTLTHCTVCISNLSEWNKCRPVFSFIQGQDNGRRVYASKWRKQTSNGLWGCEFWIFLEWPFESDCCVQCT